MPDTSKQGTGDTFLEIDLGDVGKIIIQDDGAHDPDTTLRIYDWNDDCQFSRTISTWRDYRENDGDAEFEAQLLDGLAETREGAIAKAPSSTTFETRGPFICDDCHLTWPSKDNQTPEGRKDLCPNCASDE